MNLMIFALASVLLTSPAFAGDLDSHFRTNALTAGSTGQSEPGFDEKYQRDYNIFAPVNQHRPDNPLNPITSVDPNNPFNPAFVAGDGRLLIGQLATTDGSAFEGSMLVQSVGIGGPGTTYASFTHVIPTPGTLAMLGFAGVVAARRRRR